jgi:hypothetical protein
VLSTPNPANPEEEAAEACQKAEKGVAEQRRGGREGTGWVRRDKEVQEMAEQVQRRVEEKEKVECATRIEEEE